MRKIISLICVLLPIVTYADPLELRENAPDRHVVVKGDTLWDISATFFMDPWNWQQIWGLNKDTIKDLGENLKPEDREDWVWIYDR